MGRAILKCDHIETLPSIFECSEHQVAALLWFEHACCAVVSTRGQSHLLPSRELLGALSSMSRRFQLAKFSIGGALDEVVVHWSAPTDADALDALTARVAMELRLISTLAEELGWRCELARVGEAQSAA